MYPGGKSAPVYINEYPIKNKPQAAPVYREPSDEEKINDALARMAPQTQSLENLCPQGNFDCEDFMFLVDSAADTRGKRQALFAAGKEDFLEAKNHIKMLWVNTNTGPVLLLEQRNLNRALGQRNNDIKGVIAMFKHETFTAEGLGNNLLRLCSLMKQNAFS